MAMKKLAYPLALLFVVLSAQSCLTYTEKVYTASFYTERDAYNLGYRDGARDRALGKAHNPHINEPFETPDFHTKEYLWGYTHGYAGKSRVVFSGSSK